VHAAKSFTIVGILKPIVAEALVALHATELNRDLGLRRIIVKDDTLKVVKSTGHNWSKLIN
jgi:hypothetical protein